MKCPQCKESGTLFAEVSLRVHAPLVKGGGVKMSGVRVGQDTVKEAWGAMDKRGPVNCVFCASVFHYDTTGPKPGLKLGMPNTEDNQLELPLESSYDAEETEEEAE